jgi:putative transposase
MGYRRPYRHRSIRLRDYDYSSAGAYFVTICTANRVKSMGQIVNGEVSLSDIGRIAYECLYDTVGHFPAIDLDEFVIMPDHIHLIIFIHDRSGAVHAPQDTSHERSGAIPAPQDTNHARNGAVHAPDYRNPRNALGKIVAYFKYRACQKANSKLWQRNFYEHIIRDEKELLDVRNYIRNNPLSWELDEYYVN